MFAEKGIFGCEVGFQGCTKTLMPTFAHRHKRRWYLNKGESINSFGQIILACMNCHDKMEKNKQLTKEIFEKLRGRE